MSKFLYYALPTIYLLTAIGLTVYGTITIVNACVEVLLLG